MEGVTSRLFNFAVAASVAVFCLIAAAWLAAGGVDPRKQFIRLSAGFHLTLHAHGADARVVVFSDPTDGPYTGSILALAGDPNAPTVSGIGDVAGIYYRMIRWPDGQSLWTVSLSLIYPLIAAALLPCAWIIRRSRRARRGFPVDRVSAAV